VFQYVHRCQSSSTTLGLFVRVQASDQALRTYWTYFPDVLQFLLKRVGEIWHRAPNRLNQVGEKPDRVVVVLSIGQPCALQTCWVRIWPHCAARVLFP